MYGMSQAGTADRLQLQGHQVIASPDQHSVDLAHGLNSLNGGHHCPIAMPGAREGQHVTFAQYFVL